MGGGAGAVGGVEKGSEAGHRKSRAHTGSAGLRGEPPSYCSKRMFRRSPLLMRTMQSFSWKRPCCSAFPPLSRRLTNKPRVLKRAETSVSEAAVGSGTRPLPHAGVEARRGAGQRLGYLLPSAEENLDFGSRGDGTDPESLVDLGYGSCWRPINRSLLTDSGAEAKRRGWKMLKMLRLCTCT